MIKICICDDRIEDLEYAFDLVKEFAESNPEYAINLRKFQSAYDLLDCIEASCSFDIIILDIVLPHINGIEVAKKIRQRKEPCEIIFCEFIQRIWRGCLWCKCIQLYCKAHHQRRLQQDLRGYYQKLKRNDRQPLIIKVKGGLRKVAASDIVTIESFNRRRGLRCSAESRLKQERHSLRCMSC